MTDPAKKTFIRISLMFLCIGACAGAYFYFLAPEVNESTPVAATQAQPAAAPANQAPETETKKMELIEPEHNHYTWVKDVPKVKFRWAGPSRKYHFIVSRTEDFIAKLYEQDVEGTELELSEPLKEMGDFYWKVEPIQEGNAAPVAVVSHKLSIEKDSAPSLVSPEDKTLLDARNEDAPESNLLELQWSDTGHSKEFQIQIGKDADFKELVVDQVVQEARLGIQHPPPGEYYWHVRSVHPQRDDAPWSEARAFRIDEPVKRMIAPQILNTKLNYQIPFQFVDRTQNPENTISIQPPPSFPALTWEAVPGAQRYKVEYAQNDGFREAQVQLVEQAQSFSLPQIAPGTYYYRVTALRENAEGPPSAVVKCRVSLMAPPTTLMDPVVMETDNPAQLNNLRAEVNLSWLPMIFAHSYELQVATNEAFTNNRSMIEKSGSRKIALLRPGRYFWRVRALALDRSPLSIFSPTQVVEYQTQLRSGGAEQEMAAVVPSSAPAAPSVAANAPEAAPLPSPTSTGSEATASEPNRETSSAPATSPQAPKKVLFRLLEPKKDSAITAIEGVVPVINFKFKTNAPTGSQFQLQIASDAEFKTILNEPNSTSTELKFEQGLNEGDIYWRVKAVSPDGTSSSWSKTSVFKYLKK